MSIQSEYQALVAELAKLEVAKPDSPRIPEIEARIEELAQENNGALPPCDEVGPCGHLASTMGAAQMNIEALPKRKSA